MRNNCAICGRSTSKLVINSAHPEKPVCLNCLNGFIANLSTIEDEFKLLSDALSKAVTDLKDKLDTHQV